MRQQFSRLIILLAGTASALATAAAVPDTLEQRIKACTACHAPKERHDAFFPRIAGKPAGYLYKIGRAHV